MDEICSISIRITYKQIKIEHFLNNYTIYNEFSSPPYSYVILYNIKIEENETKFQKIIKNIFNIFS